jgi:ATP-dependent RNA/DNA helicase IGHMBP2
MTAAAHSTLTDIPKFCEEQNRFLRNERQAEIEELAVASADGAGLSSLEAAGIAITRLSLVGRHVAASGRVTVEMATRGGRVLSAPRISTGDLVSIRLHHQPKAGPAKHSNATGSSGARMEGVLSLLEDSWLQIVLSGDGGDSDADAGATQHDSHGQLYAIVQVGSDATYKRQRHALVELAKASTNPSHPSFGLVQCLFRGAAARKSDENALELSHAQQQILSTLNESQQSAVIHAMCSNLAVIWGPPGCGKTMSLSAYVALEVMRGSRQRILVVAPSNAAVDNMAERLALLSAQTNAKIRFVRAGHPARVHPAVAEHTLEARLAQTDEAGLARDCMNECAVLDEKARKARSGERRALRAEMRDLRKEARKRERDALRRLLGTVDVVLSTTAGAGGRVLEHATATAPFDIVCVDEAGQGSEISCLIALLRGKRAILCGDPCQLAPTVKSKGDSGQGLSKTLLDRIFSSTCLRPQVRMLDTQYRMHEVISKWSSDAFYDGKMKPHPSVATRLVKDLPGVDALSQEAAANLDTPFILYDTAGLAGFEESSPEDDDKSLLHASKSNAGEADVVLSHVQDLLESGVSPSSIGIISPYSGQVQTLRSLLRNAGVSKQVEISTVDSFQGREMDVIVLSLVRSNARRVCGFLSDRRRLNVAITRARRSVVMICDSQTISKDPFLSDLVDYASEHGDYRLAPESTIERHRSGANGSVNEDNSRGGSKAAQHDKSAQSGNYKTAARVEGKAIKASKKIAARNKFVDRKLIEREIQEFCQDLTAKEKEFDALLSPFNRLVVHEIAERRGLLHETRGVGPERTISIAKYRISTDEVEEEKGSGDEGRTKLRSGFALLQGINDDNEDLPDDTRNDDP